MHKTILILISLFIPALFVLTGSASVEPAPALQPTEDASVDSCEMLYEKLHLDSVVSRRAFRQAVEGYKKIEQRRKDILTLIDFSKPSTEQRAIACSQNDRGISAASSSITPASVMP